MRPGTTVFEANELYGNAINAIHEGNFLEAARMLYDAALGGCSLAIKLFTQKDGLKMEMPPAGSLRWDEADETDKDTKFAHGLCYFFGLGVEHSDEIAKSCFEELELVYPAAKHMFAFMYAHGRAGIGLTMEQQVSKAVELYEGNIPYVPSVYNLAMMYYEGVAGSGMEKSERYKRASSLYKIAADQGVVGAQNYLGEMYYKGIAYIDHGGISAIKLSPKEQNIEAVKLFHKAAEQGSASAQCTLARLYEDGVIGSDEVERKAEAVRRYQLSADWGCVEAKCSLGRMYEMNWLGSELVIYDRLQLAMGMYKSVATQGSITAAYFIARLYTDEHFDMKALALKWYVYCSFLSATVKNGLDIYDRVIAKIDAMREKSPQQQYALAAVQSLKIDNPSMRLEALGKLEKFSDYQIFLEKDIEYLGDDDNYLGALLARVEVWPLMEEDYSERLTLYAALLKLTKNTISGFIANGEFDGERLEKIIQCVKVSRDVISPAEMDRSDMKMGGQVSAIVSDLSVLALVQESPKEKELLCQYILSILSGLPSNSEVYDNAEIKSMLMQTFVAAFSSPTFGAVEQNFCEMDAHMFKSVIEMARSVLESSGSRDVMIGLIDAALKFTLGKIKPMVPSSVTTTGIFSAEEKERSPRGVGVPVSDGASVVSMRYGGQAT
ncbi:MAG: tetratricopeptide repeat protein [Coxiellaceae bacterium]|nr:tetratricopeptide repeat protein [Coxiellaceae bacterium]